VLGTCCGRLCTKGAELRRMLNKFAAEGYTTSNECLKEERVRVYLFSCISTSCERVNGHNRPGD
jgi:hypothetical protein